MNQKNEALVTRLPVKSFSGLHLDLSLKNNHAASLENNNDAAGYVVYLQKMSSLY